jgi:hypothetical protein
MQGLFGADGDCKVAMSERRISRLSAFGACAGQMPQADLRHGALIPVQDFDIGFM